MDGTTGTTVDVDIVAVPETSGSALYGMVDVLSAAGEIWQTLMHESPVGKRFGVRIVGPSVEPFRCGYKVPVVPDAAWSRVSAGSIVILPELWLDPDETIHGRYDGLMAWLRAAHASGAELYSACSGAIMLAESGLLDGCLATSHWGYGGLFRRDYPQVDFRPEPNLVVADDDGRIVLFDGTAVALK